MVTRAGRNDAAAFLWIGAVLLTSITLFLLAAAFISIPARSTFLGLSLGCSMIANLAYLLAAVIRARLTGSSLLG